MGVDRDVQDVAAALRRQAQSANHRFALVLAGTADWSRQGAEAILRCLAVTKVTWLSDHPLAQPHLPLSAGISLLGRELDALVFDAHSGFDPDSLGAAVGCLRGGGLLLLLAPRLESWPDLPDPQAVRLAVHPYTEHQIGGRFLARLVRVLEGCAGVTLARQGRAVQSPDLVTGPQIPTLEHAPPTADQLQAVDAILSTARGRARRPLVLTSDRGRGKTSALGMAAARLLAERGRTILVTAPRRAAVDPLFLHASRLLPGAEVRKRRIAVGGAWLEFLPPDALCLTHREADLLLVDEAAGIPAPLLERLLRAYARVVFATTIHGYEGTGRGFELRFRRYLDRATPGWRALRLEVPVRYAPNDPLEALAARALLLDAEPAPDAEISHTRPDQCHFEHLNRDTLARDDRTLFQVFGLLVLAHYQTRPMDLRHLLDGPNVQIYVLRHGGWILATALIALEGGFERKLAQAIFEGRRRPRGHLLPQTLSAHAGLQEAAGLRFARVLRIAVHPARHGQGFGARLMRELVAVARATGLDLVGASFGASEDLLDFWLHCGFVPVHMGTTRNAASGAHAAVVLQPLSEGGHQLQTRAQKRLGERLPILLAGPLRDIEPEIAARLLASAPSGGPEPDGGEWSEIEAFAFAQRPYEAALPPLAKLLRARLGPGIAADLLDESERDVLIAKVLQHRGWSEIADSVGVAGRAGVIALLRRATARLLRRFSPDGRRS